MAIGFPTVEYPVTRTLHWRFLAPLTYTGAILIIVGLSLLNTALVGYDTVHIFHTDFNVTQSLWFHHFAPLKPKPGTLCDPHLLNVGDHIKTSYGIFDWTLQFLASANATTSNPGVMYKGDTLTSCDISNISFSLDAESDSFQSRLVMKCTDLSGFEAQASTSFMKHLLPSVTPDSSDVAGVVSEPDHSRGDAWVQTLEKLISLAFLDALNLLEWENVNLVGEPRYQLHVFASLDAPCPVSMSQLECGSIPPKFNIFGAYWTGGGSSDTTWRNPGPRMTTNDTHPFYFNLLHTIYAMARVDLGIDSPNNFLLGHREAIPLILNRTLPYTDARNSLSATNSSLYMALVAPYRNIPNYAPPIVEEPAMIQVAYLCRSRTLKPAGSLFIAVLVAVLSMFSGGWTVYIWGLSKLAKRTPADNTCEMHKPKSFRSTPSEEINVSLESEEPGPVDLQN